MVILAAGVGSSREGNQAPKRQERQEDSREAEDNSPLLFVLCLLGALGVLALNRLRPRSYNDRMNTTDPLDLSLPPVREWFRSRVGSPTLPQRLGWPAIAAGQNTLILAPTGSGKTLAAFLACLDHL